MNLCATPHLLYFYKSLIERIYIQYWFIGKLIRYTLALKMSIVADNVIDY